MSLGFAARINRPRRISAKAMRMDSDGVHKASPVGLSIGNRSCRTVKGPSMPSILHKSKPVPVTGTINSHFKEKERELIEEEYTRIGLERSTWDLYDVIARSSKLRG